MGIVKSKGAFIMFLIVLLTALAVGGSTMAGAAAGYLFRGAARRLGEGLLLSFAAGMMLSAAVAGLIIPALEGGGAWRLPLVLSGILCGGAFLLLLSKCTARLMTPHEMRGALLFLAAIAIHNFPEGIAAGVGFGSGSIPQALAIAAGIAAQNVPEGMVLIAPLLRSGLPPRRALLLSMATGIPEIIGTFLGFGAVSLSTAALPFVLAFAGGTMLYVICQDMIPEAQSHRRGTAALLLGFCFMLAIDVLVG